MDTIQSKVIKLHPLNPGVPKWRWTTSGKFSVKSAYKCVSYQNASSNSGLHKIVWKLPVPQRCCSFMWLALRGSFLTNSVSFAQSNLCCLCENEVESGMHALCFCSHAIASKHWCYYVILYVDFILEKNNYKHNHIIHQSQLETWKQTKEKIAGAKERKNENIPTFIY